MFTLRADPVLVSTAGKPNDAPLLQELSKRSDLLYLGQANGTVVLYDSVQQQALYLPANAIILKISVCRTHQSNPRCAEGIRYF